MKVAQRSLLMGSMCDSYAAILKVAVHDSVQDTLVEQHSLRTYNVPHVRFSAKVGTALKVELV